MQLNPGDHVLIETVTHYWVGRLISRDGPYTVTITDFAWVAETGRYHVFLRDGRADGMEVEPAPDGMEKEVHGITGITKWPHPLFREVM